MTAIIGFIWNQVLIAPATNFMVVLDRLLFGNYGLAIIVFTLFLRLVTLPLTLRQMRSSKKMSQLQPKMQEIQKKYSDPKRRSEETMKLYKQEGVNPAGCLVPTLIQFPIWIALYQVIRLTLGNTPESLIDLSHRLYPWSFIQHAVPLTSHFLWMNLGLADQTYILPFLVFATMWLQQKLTMTRTAMAANSQSAQTNQMMLWFMPLIFAWLSLNLPSGLGLYWIMTNVVGIVMNYFVFEWHGTHPADIVGLRNFSLSNVGSIFMPPARKPGTRPVRRPQAPARDRGRNSANGQTESSDEQPATRFSGGSSNGAARGQSRRRNAAPPARKAQPKAPPVGRRLPPAPGSEGGTETRSNDG